MRTLQRDPCLDPDLGEEVLHASLRRGGWTHPTLYWMATLLARCVSWVNALRAAGLPSTRELAVMAELRRAIADRKDELLELADPPTDWDGWELMELEHPGRNTIRHPGGLDAEMYRPPAGWHLEDTP